MSKPINVYSISEVALSLDESLPDIFGRLDYKQTFRLIDQKLIIGYSIAIVAATSFILDKKFGHNEVIPYQTALVSFYFILSIIFWYFKKYVEKSTVYEGTNTKTGEKISVKTSYVEAEPFYNFVLSNSKGKSLNVKLEINKVFNEPGFLQTNLFYEWINTQLQTLDAKKNE
ncbi:hypothetical protein KAFR_0I00510 [Kazachstania africana CBS 2517]|uniref:Signal peptidase complex subunit 2 n=1 Tax=Kazachstania africana (strain ATCC 22294 / BCRC 22015 / CBS 2517 / CECT 1963 / NBRC 1671 / NRRL Y-8276) TaxID=1071382 RepID=H2AZN2_KAZAF|nr:hypothetical protein KAFR_0I00510 [Kazachstania africana CBS 2517]CCF59832.1 hypothetical protein KAFR_0I00510 [Kazachstania africana CBS 2517]